MNDTPTVVIFKAHRDSGIPDYVLDRWLGIAPPAEGDSVFLGKQYTKYVVRDVIALQHHDAADSHFCYVMPVESDT